MAKKQDLVSVIASRAKAVDYWAFMHYLPNPDPVLKKMGKDISAYREILSDSHVGGCVRRRKAAIKGLEWRLTTTDNEKIDEILTALFERLPVSQLIGQLLDAALFGYQVCEIMWGNHQGIWLPEKIEAKPQEWFIFDEDNQLRLRTKANPVVGEALPEKKFLLVTQQADYVNPYGRADLALCFWAATFKKGGLKFWLEFVEKYATPFLLGKHPRQAQLHEIDDLLDSLEQMVGNAVAAVPDDSSIELLESSGKSGSSQIFDEFLRYCKSEISVALLGQDQTTEADSNRASAVSGLEVTRAIRDDDASLVETAFNQLLAWICELNFNVATLPKFELYEQESIDKLQAERDQILASLGVEFSTEYLERTYGFEQGDIRLKPQVIANPEQAKEPKSAVSFAEDFGHYNMTENIVGDLEREGEPYVENWLQAVQDKLSQAESLEDFRSQLDSLIPELTFAEYAQVMAWASTTAFFAGKQSVEDERKR